MRRKLCQMWNLSREELARQDARSLLRDTELVDLWDAEMIRKAQTRAR